MREWLVATLRKVTITVKVAPFFLALFYMLTILGYMYMPETIIYLLDTLLYCSPIMVAFLIVLSKQLRLCFWHRLECSLPVLCMFPGMIDSVIFPLSEVATYINAVTLSFLLLLSLVNAYFVFVKPSVKRR